MMRNISPRAYEWLFPLEQNLYIQLLQPFITRIQGKIPILAEEIDQFLALYDHYYILKNRIQDYERFCRESGLQFSVLQPLVFETGLTQSYQQVNSGAEPNPAEQLNYNFNVFHSLTSAQQYVNFSSSLLSPAQTTELQRILSTNQPTCATATQQLTNQPSGQLWNILTNDSSIFQLNYMASQKDAFPQESAPVSAMHNDAADEPSGHEMKHLNTLVREESAQGSFSKSRARNELLSQNLSVSASQSPRAGPSRAHSESIKETRGNEPTEKRRFTEQQCEYIVRLKDSKKKYTYVEIAELLNQRFNTEFDAKAVQQKYVRSLNPAVTKGRWTADQDALLSSLHAKHNGDFDKIQREMRCKTVTQIRSRWAILTRAK